MTSLFSIHIELKLNKEIKKLRIIYFQSKKIFKKIKIIKFVCSQKIEKENF